MKMLTTFLCLVLIIGLCHAAVLRVARDGTAPYSEVQQAINVAAPADTIVIAPGWGYSGFLVDRQLVIFGAGTEDTTNTATRIEGDVSILNTADGTQLWSVWIIGNHTGLGDSTAAVKILSGATGVQIARCFIDGSSSAFGVFLGNYSSVQIRQTTLISGYGVIANQGGAAGAAHVESCLFVGQFPFDGGSGSTRLTYEQCVLDAYSQNASGFSTPAFGSVTNCVALGNWRCFNCPQEAPNLSFTYCASTGTPPPGIGNIPLTEGSGYYNFVNRSGNNPHRSDYHLRPESALNHAGDPLTFNHDSTRADIGIYGGQNPYVDKGTPVIPVVSQLEVPSSVPQNGTLHIGARGRVGPGN